MIIFCRNTDQSSVLLQTLRVMSALEHLFDKDKGYKTNILLAQVKSSEVNHGPEVTKTQFLSRQDFVDFADQAKASFLSKIESGQISSENPAIRGVRTCIDNITLLLQMSTLKPTVKPTLNLEKYQDPLKVRIAETIISHFKGDISQVGLLNW